VPDAHYAPPGGLLAAGLGASGGVLLHKYFFLYILAITLGQIFGTCCFHKQFWIHFWALVFEKTTLNVKKSVDLYFLRRWIAHFFFNSFWNFMIQINTTQLLQN
jgi:hypothetical protein